MMPKKAGRTSCSDGSQRFHIEHHDFIICPTCKCLDMDSWSGNICLALYHSTQNVYFTIVGTLHNVILEYLYT